MSSSVWSDEYQLAWRWFRWWADWDLTCVMEGPDFRSRVSESMFWSVVQLLSMSNCGVEARSTAINLRVRGLSRADGVIKPQLREVEWQLNCNILEFDAAAVEQSSTRPHLSVSQRIALASKLNKSQDNGLNFGFSKLHVLRWMENRPRKSLTFSQLLPPKCPTGEVGHVSGVVGGRR